MLDCGVAQKMSWTIRTNHTAYKQPLTNKPLGYNPLAYHAPAEAVTSRSYCLTFPRGGAPACRIPGICGRACILCTGGVWFLGGPAGP